MVESSALTLRSLAERLPIPAVYECQAALRRCQEQAEISARAQSARFVTSGYEPRRRGFVAASPAEDEDEDDRPHGYVPGMGTAPSGFRFPGPRYRRGEPQVQQAAEAEPSGQGSVQEGMSAAREVVQQAGQRAEIRRDVAQGAVPPLVIPDFNSIRVGDVQTNCAVQSVMATIGGAVMGLLFGAFFGSMETAGGGNAMLGGVTVEENTTVRKVLSEMVTSIRTKSVSYAKSFAWMGFLFAGSECVIEKWRAKTDIYNSVSAGCVTGATLAYGTGPKGMCIGCAGFAAFSAAIDKFLGRH